MADLSLVHIIKTEKAMMNQIKLVGCLFGVLFFFNSTSYAESGGRVELHGMSQENEDLNGNSMDEFQNYRVVEGELNPVRPHSKSDLSDAPITGSDKNESSLRLNWFISSNFFISADYVSVDYGRYATEADYARGSDDSGLFQTSIQLNF